MSIDAGTRRRLILGLVSSWITKVAGAAIQLIQVPFFLHFWSENVFGNWLIVTAVPNYLSFSSIGFGTTAGNEMTMSEARGDREASLRVFQSCWWLIVIVLICTGALVGIGLAVFPVARLLGIAFISESDTRWMIVFLMASMMMGQLEQLLQSTYRAVGRYPYGSFVRSCISLAAFAATLVPVCLGFGPRTAALVFASANIAGTLLLSLMVRQDVPWIRFGWRHARFDEIKRMTSPSLAFIGFPVGNALNLQGTLQAVGYAMGPVAVVVFATARTVSRVALQMVQMINQTFEPEFSKSFAQQNVGLVRTLHRRACQAGLLVAFTIVIAMILAGPYLLSHWTQGKVPPSRPLLSILLLVVIFYSLWSTSSTILTATNQHKRLAAVYLSATSLTVCVTWLLARRFGLYGAAASLLLSEFCMNLYVLPATLRIAHDTFPSFARSLFTVPPALHPRALLRRLARSRPEFES